jgi:hypothetical protein
MLGMPWGKEVEQLLWDNVYYDIVRLVTDNVRAKADFLTFDIEEAIGVDYEVSTWDSVGLSLCQNIREKINEDQEI